MRKICSDNRAQLSILAKQGPATAAFWAGGPDQPAKVSHQEGDLAVFSEIQQCVLAETVKPNTAPGVTITDTHRDHPNVGGVPACLRGWDNDFAYD